MILRRVVAENEDGMRLGRFLRYPMGLAAGYISRLKLRGAFCVNGNPVHTNYTLNMGDVVTADLSEPAPEFPAEDGPLSILYEDEAVLAVDKPAGLLIHPSTKRLTGTLANRVLHYYQKTGQHCAVHILTRLDRDTCGVVLLSKNAYVHDILTRSLKAGEIHKTYLAPVFSAPEADAGIWDWPIFRPDPRAMRRCADERGQAAETQFRVRSRHDGWSALELRPRTGRTHQLRIHCLTAGCPILGDPMYFTAESAAAAHALGWEYQRLLARSLTFRHPLTKRELTLSAPIPADFWPEDGRIPADLQEFKNSDSNTL